MLMALKIIEKNIVTTIAYLIGVSEDKLENEGIFDLAEYEKLKNHENATVIRNIYPYF